MREGRGQLSSLDLLPEEAQEDMVWAIGEIYEGRRTQADILFEFNDRLAVKGCSPISKSAFSRKKLRLAAKANQNTETAQIVAALSGTMNADKVDEQTIVIGHFLKQLIFELLEPGQGRRTPDDLMKLARGFKDVAAALKISSERHSQLVKEANEKATKAVDLVAKSRGLSAETVKAIKAEILGISDDEPKADTAPLEGVA